MGGTQGHKEPSAKTAQYQTSFLTLSPQSTGSHLTVSQLGQALSMLPHFCTRTN